MRRVIPLAVIFLLISESVAVAGLDSKKCMYVGGTVSAIPQKTVAPLDLAGEKFLIFKWAHGEWQLPYDHVTSLAYGQHAGRRIGATIAWGVTTLGIMALPILLSKKRRHYLTVEYADVDGKPQAAIFEIGKDAIRSTLKILEVRTGKKLEYEDEEARKAGNK